VQGDVLRRQLEPRESSTVSVRRQPRAQGKANTDAARWAPASSLRA
jgi:hypothetical protein